MRRNESRPARGFTLIELLVVLVILGMLAGLVGPQVMKYLGSSKSKTARLQIEELSAALDLYRLELGRYPSAEEGLGALVQAPAGREAQWNGPYLKKKVVPKDPWGTDFHYRFPGEQDSYDLFSLGADNAAGGEGEDADILGWE
ncbi:MAG TPA: type II secretion system major pseudopilin GspG [Gammaproteobacteria bacterium]